MLASRSSARGWVQEPLDGLGGAKAALCGRSRALQALTKGAEDCCVSIVFQAKRGRRAAGLEARGRLQHCRLPPGADHRAVCDCHPILLMLVGQYYFATFPFTCAPCASVRTTASLVDYCLCSIPFQTRLARDQGGGSRELKALGLFGVAQPHNSNRLSVTPGRAPPPPDRDGVRDRNHAAAATAAAAATTAEALQNAAPRHSPAPARRPGRSTAAPRAARRRCCRLAVAAAAVHNNRCRASVPRLVAGRQPVARRVAVAARPQQILVLWWVSCESEASVSGGKQRRRLRGNAATARC